MGNCCSTRQDIRVRPNIKAMSKKAMSAVRKHQQNVKDMERFVQSTIEQGKPWTDPEFPPQRLSLYDPQIDQEVDPSLYDSFQWKRGGQIFNPVHVFADGIDPNDVNQGQLGDCYFLATLSSLAEFPNRVRAMFVTQEINKAGIYMMRFFLNGQDTPVIVDDYMPVDADGNPVFATCRDGELWVSLLEKAWAKLHGTYARTEGGLPSFAANHIMGVPAEAHDHDEVTNPDDFWAQLESADRRNFVMMAASHGQGEAVSANGLVAGHAYSLISIHELKSNGKYVRLLKLRNPWGAGEWTGDWSDKSDLWTTGLKRTVGLTDADDGIFFIELSDYLENFAWTSLCVENNAARYEHSQLQHSFEATEDSTPLPQAFFKFTLTRAIDFNKTAFAITVLQQGDRLANYRQKDFRKKFDPSRFNIVLMTEDGEYVIARFGEAFSFSLLNDKVMLQPGKYVFMVDPLWNQAASGSQQYRNVLIDIYGPEAVNIETVDDIQGMKYLAQALKHAAQTISPEDSRENYLEENEDYGNKVMRVQDIENLPCWYGYIYTRNDSPHMLNETLRPQLEGLEVVYPFIQEGEQDIVLSIKPGQDHIVILRRNMADCHYGLQFMTHARELSDDQLVENAKNLGDEAKTYFGQSSAFYKLDQANTNTFVFYIENDSQPPMVLNAEFTLTMENLAIQGEPKSANSFKVELQPKASTFKFLKPINDQQAVSLELRYTCSFKK